MGVISRIIKFFSVIFCLDLVKFVSILSIILWKKNLHGSSAKYRQIMGQWTTKTCLNWHIFIVHLFQDMVRDFVGENYWLIKSVNLGQMRLMVFIATPLYPALSQIKNATQATGKLPMETISRFSFLHPQWSLGVPWSPLVVATGVANVATNKGGMAISFKYWDTELAFVNSHLAAHQDKVRSRNNMYRNIIRGVRTDKYNMDLLTGFHHVFWVGDLNYRVDFGNPTNTPSEEDFDKMVRSLQAWCTMEWICDKGSEVHLLQLLLIEMMCTWNMKETPWPCIMSDFGISPPNIALHMAVV